jgi:hypothetical protein
MINVNEASARAIEHLKKLYPDDDLGHILFEEAELTDDDRFWIVVLSFRNPVPAGGWASPCLWGTGATRCLTCWQKPVRSGR